MRLSTLRVLFYTFCLFCLGTWHPVHAFQRVFQPMGYYIQASPLIVIADVKTDVSAEKIGRLTKDKHIITVSEVLRGDAQQGDSIEIPLVAPTNWILPREAQNIAVLFNADWKTKPSVIEVLQTPEQISVLRELVKIYDLEGERAQLLALQERAVDPNPLFGKQLVADFARMREEKNFDIVLGSLEKLNAESQGELIGLLGKIADERAVPLLLQALQSSQRTLSSGAANVLIANFPESEGVKEAFQALSQNPEARPLALYYLNQYAPTFAATLPQPEPTLWQQAKNQLVAGDTAAAKESYFAIIQRQGQANWASFEAARSVLPLLDERGKTQLRQILNAYLMKENVSYVDAEAGIELLRRLPDESNTETLLHLMHTPDANSYAPWSKTTYAATFALRELGPQARQKALQQVIERINKRLKVDSNVHPDETHDYLCQLVWLSDENTWKEVLGQLPPQYASRMEALQPLREAANSENEAAALAALLPDTTNRWQGNTSFWIIRRLANLRDTVAIEPLFAELKRSRFNTNVQELRAALIAIGGAEVESLANQLLTDEEVVLRYYGMDILYALRGKEMRPLLLRMLTEPEFGDKSYAITLLGSVGQHEDLPQLLPLANFWQGERTLQARARDAVVSIRSRTGGA